MAESSLNRNFKKFASEEVKAKALHEIRTKAPYVSLKRLRIVLHKSEDKVLQSFTFKRVIMRCCSFNYGFIELVMFGIFAKFDSPRWLF